MTDKSKPEELDDQDLDQAQGGFIAYGAETGAAKANRKPREGFNGHQGDEPAMVKSGMPGRERWINDGGSNDI